MTSKLFEEPLSYIGPQIQKIRGKRQQIVIFCTVIEINVLPFGGALRRVLSECTFSVMWWSAAAISLLVIEKHPKCIIGRYQDVVGVLN